MATSGENKPSGSNPPEELVTKVSLGAPTPHADGAEDHGDVPVEVRGLVPSSGHPSWQRIAPGALVDGRFEIEAVAGSGGMGIVYRARDRDTGSPVALKLLLDMETNLQRFEREARLLSEMDHPGIVGYVQHGRTGEGQVYLAMEWLSGHDLATRLNEHRFTVEESVDVALATADALALAHERGVVHRDINPRNLFCLQAAPGTAVTVKVLDFGIARPLESSLSLTVGGALGTPGYIAPEQAQGGGEIGPTADVFSLGCVLFECLTGRRAFSGQTLMELLARILVDEPPRIVSIVPEAPRELDALVARMLDKDPRRRPKDAGAVRDALVTIREELVQRGPLSAPLSARLSAVSELEQKLSCIVMAHPVSADAFARLAELAQQAGVELKRLRSDGIVAVLASRSSATEQAAEAARFALRVRDLLGDAQVAVATGRALATGQATVGEAIERASAALNDSVDAPRSGARIPVRIDAVTKGLLDSRFDVRTSLDGFQLRRELSTGEPTRTVLGRQTRVVGRRRELEVCESTLAECIAESLAHAVLVTGPPGIGKTRLAQEFLHIARRRWPEVHVMWCRCEPTSAGSPYRPLARALRGAAQIVEAEPEALSRQKLGRFLSSKLGPRDAARVGTFLGELIGLPSGEDPQGQLRVAREDPVLLGDQMLRALLDWIGAHCQEQPLLILIDDLQWGDLSTVRALDALLRTLSEQPLMVLALAHPEVHDVFPQLWARRGVFELQLTGLSRRASESLISDTLGDRVSEDRRDWMIEQAQGNPFWLEELIRAQADGQDGNESPDAIIALAQARLERLSATERRVLRAASVFGDRFWLDGVRALLGPGALADSAGQVVQGLCAHEVVSPSELTRFPGQKEFEFSSSLYRLAAYRSLPEQDRQEGHLQAGHWLESLGETDSVQLAMHYREGGQPSLAVDFYRRGAEQALLGNDLGGAIAQARQGLEAGADGDTKARLALCLGEAHKWNGDNQQALDSCQMTLSAARKYDALWCRAAGEAIAAAGKLGQRDVYHRLSEALLKAPADELNEHALTVALSRAATQLVLASELVLADALLERARALTDAVNPEPALLGWLCEAQALRAGVDDPGQRLELSELAAGHFEAAGDLRNACLLGISHGYACIEIGQYERAIAALKQGLNVAERMELSNSIPIAKAQLARALMLVGDVKQALLLEQEASATFEQQQNKRLRGVAYAYLADIQLQAGMLADAERAGKEAVTGLKGFGFMRRFALAVLARIHLARGDAEGALELMKDAMAGAEQESLGTHEAYVRGTWAEVLGATGQESEAQAALKVAREHLLARSERISDPLLKQAFLERVPENRAILGSLTL